MRPCNSNNGNLCEPYDFALHGEGSSLWAVEHLIFLGFQLNTWSPHPFLFAKSWVSVIGKGTPMPHATLLPWEPFLTSEVRPCLWCESCRGHVLHCSLRGHTDGWEGKHLKLVSVARVSIWQVASFWHVWIVPLQTSFAFLRHPLDTLVYCAGKRQHSNS